MEEKLNINIMVAQIKPVPGDIEGNLEKILSLIEVAKKSGAKIIVFPELCVSGYMLGDRWEHDKFIEEIEEANRKILQASLGIVVIWGSVKADKNKIGEDGRIRKYNAAFIAQNGGWVSNHVLSGWIPKTNLPKYRIFDDARHFYPAAKLALELGLPLKEFLRPFPISIDGKFLRLAIGICEDFWEDEYKH